MTRCSAWLRADTDDIERLHHRRRSIVHHPGRYTEYTLPAHGRTYRDAIADTVHRHTGRTVTEIAATGHVGDGAHRYTAALADQPEPAETSGHNTRTVTP